MSDIKKSILQQINDRVLRKKALSAEIANRNANVEAFVLKMIDEIDSMVCSTVNTSLAPIMADYYVNSLRERVRTLDVNADVEVQWMPAENNSNLPRVTGVLIKWSQEYQVDNNCEAQLFVDPVNLLFK